MTRLGSQCRPWASIIGDPEPRAWRPECDRTITCSETVAVLRSGLEFVGNTQFMPDPRRACECGAGWRIPDLFAVRSTIRKDPSPQSVVLIARLARPADFAMAGEPERLDVDHGQRDDAERDEDPSSTEAGDATTESTAQSGGMPKSPMQGSPPSLLCRESLWDCIGKSAWTQAWFQR